MTGVLTTHVSGLKALARPAIQLLREVPVHHARFRQRRGPRPLAVFLPAYGPTGAALLRIYNIAQAMRPLGWRTLVLPPKMTLAQRLRFLRRAGPDVLVMQGARHGLNRPALYPDWPVVFDMDDADFHLPHLAQPVTRAMASVAAVTAGSAYVADWCLAAGAPRAEIIWTGTPPSARARVPATRRPPVVAWAQTRPVTYVREAALVARLMQDLAARQPGVTLRLYDRRFGDDPGFLDPFRAKGVTVEWIKACSYKEYLASFDDVAVGLAPLAPDTPFSRGKSFGKVLAYLDRGVPVIGSDAGEHGRFFTPETGVITNDSAAWVTALDQLLTDPARRQAMADAATAAFRSRLTTEVAAKAMIKTLEGLMSTGPARRAMGVS